MGIHIHIHHESDSDTREQLKIITNKLNQIIMTDQEAIDKINGLTTQLGKVKTEVEALIAAVQNQGNVSPALAQAISNAETALQGVDDLNPDAE